MFCCFFGYLDGIVNLFVVMNYIDEIAKAKRCSYCLFFPNPRYLVVS
jgi:hypothetical protein